MGLLPLSLLDAIPILARESACCATPCTPCCAHAPMSRISGWPRKTEAAGARRACASRLGDAHLDRKSTRLNSSHSSTEYAVFCLIITMVATAEVKTVL